MGPLIVLLLILILSLVVVRMVKGRYDTGLSARLAMSVMLLFTGIFHFIYTKGMVLMIPEIIPGKLFIVYLTGILEVLAATGLMIPRYQKNTGAWLIIFFIVIFPANIYACMRHVNIATGEFTGSGMELLWLRIPLQIIFIVWVYFAVIKNNAVSK